AHPGHERRPPESTPQETFSRRAVCRAPSEEPACRAVSRATGPRRRQRNRKRVRGEIVSRGPPELYPGGCNPLRYIKAGGMRGVKRGRLTAQARPASCRGVTVPCG